MWPGDFRDFHDIKVFLIALILIVSLFIAVIFLGIYLRTNKLLMETVKNQAVSYFELIVQTRSWNARYGGVYVEKKGEVQSNPYLRDIGVEPDITCEKNRVFTMRNPALMAKEISQLTGADKGVQFHITSLNPINPENRPDAFEHNALQQFEKGIREVWSADRSVSPPVFRYMAPLYVEESCLPCHKKQGYRIHEIRGGISVLIPLPELEKKMKTNRSMIILLSLITMFMLFGIVYFMVWKLTVKLKESQLKLKQISITDELTGIRNRRYIMDRLGEEFQRARRDKNPMGLVMVDLDHFKQVNDTHGHQFGDLVLVTVATRMLASIRGYDLLGRIGGEEFLIVSPDTDLEETLEVAQRMREIIKGEPVSDKTRSVTITISVGVTMLLEEDSGIDSLFSRADTALYMAKKEGRDRVAVL
jgi:diguanylate cyclase (GGDEF)-like protein